MEHSYLTKAFIVATNDEHCAPPLTTSPLSKPVRFMNGTCYVPLPPRLHAVVMDFVSEADAGFGIKGGATGWGGGGGVIHFRSDTFV